MGELPQWWVLAGLIATLVGTGLAIWGTVATHRARRSEARWKGPEVTITPIRQEGDGWVLVHVLVRNRLDVEMRIESIEVRKPRPALVLQRSDWKSRADTEAAASAMVRPDQAVTRGPTDKWSANLPIFLKIDGWDPYTESVQARVVLRETSMQRKKTLIDVVSMEMEPPPPEVTQMLVMHRPRDPWMSNDRDGYWDRR